MSKQMNSRYEDKLGKEPMLPLIFKMSIPAIIAQLVNLLYSMVDRIYIGHIPEIGKDALAGIGITSAIIILISAFSAIVSSGAAPLASIALGEGDRKRASLILGNGVTLLIFFSIITMTATYLFMEPVLRLIGASDKTLPYAVKYLSIYLTGTLFVQITTGLNTFINAQGRPGVAMFSVLIGAGTNIVLDPILIFGFNMGVAGAAVATVISQFLSAVWILRFLCSDNASLKIKRCYMRPSWKIIRPVFCLGIAPFIMSSTESLVGFVLNNRLAVFGDIYISALAIMQSAMQMISVPLNGFSQGVVPVISYNYGSRNVKRVKEGFKITVIVMFSFNFICVGLIVLFPHIIAQLFSNDAELIETVAKYLPLFICGMSIFGLQRACQNTFIALGQSMVSLFIALLRKVFLLVPLAIILSMFLGVNGVFAAESIADAASALLCTLIFTIKFPKILKKAASLKTDEA